MIRASHLCGWAVLLLVISHVPTAICCDTFDKVHAGITNLTLITIRNCATVNLSYNNITSINQSDFDPLNLVKTLDLSHNGILKVGKNTFDGLYNSRTLNLSNNNISWLEEGSFDGLFYLKTLDLSHNYIQLIPARAFSDLSRLEYLYITHNRLSTLPLDFFKNKYSLVTVDLSYNVLSSIPLPVFNVSLPNLLRVILHHNQMTAFEPWARVRNTISYIDLRWNPVSKATNKYNWTYTDASRGRDAALVDLRRTAITHWNDKFITQYQAPTDHTQIDILIAMMMIDIRDNDLICDCHVHNLASKFRTSLIKWSDNDLLRFKCHSPHDLHNKRLIYDVPLQKLACNITARCPAGCLCQDIPENQVISIDCRGTNLTEVPKTLPHSKYGRIKLHLDNNAIVRLDNISYAKDIIELTMANNHLNDVDKSVMKQIAAVENVKVDFSNNALTKLPKEIQNIKFQNTKLTGNYFSCDCEMVWMKSWIGLAPTYENRSLQCSLGGSSYTILDLDEGLLKCNDVGSIVLIVVLSVCLIIIVGLIITVKRCPYETKVLLFKIFRIHPADKYAVDDDTDKQYDMYVSFDDDDDYVRQWVRKRLVKQLEEKKPFYKLSIGLRDQGVGAEADARLELIDRSRRLLIILSEGYSKHQWCDYEVNHSETLDQHSGRVLYVLYDDFAEDMAKSEPWVLKMKDRKVFRLNDRMLWSKLRYELPRKSVVKKNAVAHENRQDIFDAP